MGSRGYKYHVQPTRLADLLALIVQFHCTISRSYVHFQDLHVDYIDVLLQERVSRRCQWAHEAAIHVQLTKFAKILGPSIVSPRELIKVLTGTLQFQEF